MLYEASLKWPLVKIHSPLLASGSRDANRPTHGEELPSKSCRTRGKRGDLTPALLFECAGHNATTNEVMESSRTDPHSRPGQRHFGEKFWLYVITEAATDTPQLNPIQNPAAHFRMDEDIFATGFMIPEENWRGKTESAS